MALTTYCDKDNDADVETITQIVVDGAYFTYSMLQSYVQELLLQ